MLEETFYDEDSPETIRVVRDFPMTSLLWLNAINAGMRFLEEPQKREGEAAIGERRGIAVIRSVHTCKQEGDACPRLFAHRRTSLNSFTSVIRPFIQWIHRRLSITDQEAPSHGLFWSLLKKRASNMRPNCCPFQTKTTKSLSSSVRTIIMIELSTVSHSRVTELNPRGKVPVLVEGESVVYESQAILHFLESAHPQPALIPASPKDR